MILYVSGCVWASADCQSCIGSCLKYSAVRVIDTLDQRVQQGTHIGIARPVRCQ
jgi:hypothetical protein